MNNEIGDLDTAFYEGWYTRLRCGSCDDMFEIEDDVSNGEPVECDSCGAELTVDR